MSLIRRALKRQIAALLPRSIRYSLMRDQLKVCYSPTPGLEFKVAEQKHELERAYQILHDSYVDQGYMSPESSGLRVNKYFAMPSTTTLIALIDGEVVGTMSIIRKNGLGLPIEKIFDISSVEANGKIVAEVSALAIDKRFRNKRGSLFLPLCKFFYEYITNYMKVDRAVIAVNPTWRDFYEGFLCFKVLENKKIDNYDFANGAPAIGLWGDFSELKTKFNKIYNNKPDAQNLYKYFVETPFDFFKFPDRVLNQTADPVMTPELLDYFFRHRTQTFQNMSTNELLQVASAYPQAEYLKLFPKIKGKSVRPVRHVVNFDIKSTGLSSIKVIDVSSNGMLLHGLPHDLQSVHLQIPIANGYEAKVLGVVRWRNTKTGVVGVQLVEVDKKWQAFLKHLESSFERLMNERKIAKSA